MKADADRVWTRSRARRGKAPSPPSRGSQILRWAVYLATGALLIGLVVRPSSGPTVGSVALPFSLPAAGPASGRVELASRRGDPVLLEVFAGWCATCRRAAPTVAAAFEAERARPVRFVGVALDGTLAGAERLRRSWKIPYDVAVDDGTVARGYRIDVLPTFVVLDAEGIVRHVSSGAPSRAELERWLAMVGAPAKR